MSERDVLEGFRDSGGAAHTLEDLGLSLDRAIPYLAGDSWQLAIFDAHGFWLLNEVPGSSAAAIHELEFVPFSAVEHVRFAATDDARQSALDVPRLKGTSLELWFQGVAGDIVSIEITGSDVMKGVRANDDVRRIVGLLAALPVELASSKVRVLVSQGES